MKIVLDLQICQELGTQHPLGRHACWLAKSLLRQGAEHDIRLLLNGVMPASIDCLRAEFAGLLPAGRIIIVEAAPLVGLWEMQVAAQLREATLACLRPDVVHVAEPFAFGADQRMIPPLFSDPAVVASSLISTLPLSGDTAPPAILTAQALKRADLLLTTSPEIAALVTTQLHIPEERLLPVEPATLEDEQRLDLAARTMLRAWQKLHRHKTASAPCAHHRPRLAYVSPLPPAQSGIADYSAELLPELGRFYDITLVVDQPTISAPGLAVVFPVKNVAWFEQHARSFDRILYHIGNSHFHSHMFELLLRHPGTIVLHDVFLADILKNMGHGAGGSDALLQIAYRDHGFAPLQQAHAQGRDSLLGDYPCSLQTIQRAAGVLVHSNFAREQLLAQYGPNLAPLVQQVPFLRLPPLFLPARAEARARLGLAPEAYVVCCFGFLGPTKLNHRLLAAWQRSELSRKPHCHLFFVGNNHQSVYGNELLKAMKNADRIAITGFIPQETYRDYLAAADVAVQLRGNSRGETSAAIHDCLAAGLPLVCNAHGSIAELPDDCIIKLPDHFDDRLLRQTLEQLLGDREYGRDFARRGRDYLRRHHHPAHVGQCYHQAMEHFAMAAPRAHEQRLLATLPPASSPEQRAALAAALVDNRPPIGPRQLLVDISAVARHDLKTGIERVVRGIIRELLHAPPPGYRVEPVYYNEQGGYSYARRFTLRSLGLDEQVLDDSPVQARQGDLFLGADLLYANISLVQGCLQRWRARGVRISFIVYDLLPIQRPDCFPASIEPDFRAWLQGVSAVADHLVCISRSVADELREYLSHNPPRRSLPLQVGFFHLGADIGASLPTTGLPPNTEQLLQSIAAAPAFVMVGTIEPRKGHIQAVDAFDLLWRQGVAINLVIAGKPGWMTEKLIDRLNNHPQRGRRLFCLYSSTDEMLELVYGHCTALLAASEGEGFGLPLIEAARHGLDLIVRDIPVFMEVAGGHASYFTGVTPADIADAIQHYLQQGERPRSTGMPRLTWEESVRQLLGALDGSRPSRTVHGVAG